MIQGKEEMDLIELLNKQILEEDMRIGFANLDLQGIKNWAEDISGEWNGDNPGSAEDRSHQATDIMEKVDELILLINGMENL